MSPTNAPAFELHRSNSLYFNRTNNNNNNTNNNVTNIEKFDIGFDSILKEIWKIYHKSYKVTMIGIKKFI